MKASDPDIKSFLPVSLIRDEDQALLQWYTFDDEEFHEPFFDGTLSRVKHRFPENTALYRSVSSLAFLGEFDQDGIPAPDVIVFHISRCGSTLISQLLATVKDVHSLSEVPLLDELLAIREEYQTEKAQGYFRTTVNLLRRNKTHLLIKTDSWHLLHYDFIRSCFPETPIVLLYRNPMEVWQSKQKIPGMQFVPGLLNKQQLPGFSDEVHEMLDPNTYFARLMDCYFEKMTEISTRDKNAILINYSEGAMQLAKRTAEHAGIALDQQELIKMEERSHFHSKSPTAIFSEENHPETVPDFLEKAMELYADLEKINTALAV